MGFQPRAQTVSGKLLSHHAILTFARPFSRRGYTVDMEASDRGRGMLAFRPIDLPAKPGRHPALRCVMRLERPHRAKVRVIRTLETDDGQVATMTAEGDDPTVLLDVVEQVDPDRQFHFVDAGRIDEQAAERADSEESSSASASPDQAPIITRSYRTEVWVADASRRRRAASLRLTEAEARLGPVRLSAVDKDGRGLEVRLTAEEGHSLDLTRDFLAVIGWRWRPLRRRDRDTWLGSLKLPNRQPSRTANLEAQLDKAAAHIVKTLAAPPVLFHERHLNARWRAAFQRLLPLLTICVMTVCITLAVLYLPRTPVFHMLVFYSSVLTVVGIWMLDEAYRVEIPARPRPLAQPEWCSASNG